MNKLTIKQMVKNTFERYELTRSSDEALLDCIINKYFGWDVIRFMDDRPVAFILSMVKTRQQLQMKWLYPAREEVRNKRHAYSKYYKDEYMKDQKDRVQKIVLNKKFK